MSTPLDLIRQKRDALAGKREQMMANVNVLSGAISICDELLQQLPAAADTATAGAGIPANPSARTKRKAPR